MRLELVYPSIRIDRPDQGIAIADNVRMTRTQYIVDPKYVNVLSGKIRFGGSGERSYNRQTGREIGVHIRTWHVTREINDHEQGTLCESPIQTL